MGWERRGKDGKRLVYIRKKRVGQRVTSIFCGSGERGRAAEREGLERREATKRASEAPEVLRDATSQTSEHTQYTADLMSFEEADEYVVYVTTHVNPETDLGGLISRLLTDESVKKRLREKYLPGPEGGPGFVAA
jgi:hypothetical protein